MITFHFRHIALKHNIMMWNTMDNHKMSVVTSKQFYRSTVIWKHSIEIFEVTILPVYLPDNALKKYYSNYKPKTFRYFKRVHSICNNVLELISNSIWTIAGTDQNLTRKGMMELRLGDNRKKHLTHNSTMTTSQTLHTV